MATDTDEEAPTTYAYDIRKQIAGVFESHLVETVYDVEDVGTMLTCLSVSKTSPGCVAVFDAFDGFTIYHSDGRGGLIAHATYFVEAVLAEEEPDPPFEVAKAIHYACKEAGSNPARYSTNISTGQKS